MIIAFVLLSVALLLATCLVWIFVYTVCEAWSLWAKRKFRIRFSLHSFLIASAAACMTSAIVSASRAGMGLVDAFLMVAILFPLMLGLAFLADMLLRDLYQAWKGSRSRSMRAYRAAEFDQVQTDDTGEPVIPAERKREEEAHPDRRPPRERPSSLPINPFKMFRG